MLTKEQILEVLEANSSMLDGSVQPRNFVWVANALLNLQEAIPEGYITEECPPGYVAEESFSCSGCEMPCEHTDVLCTPSQRKDDKWVIFIRKEDIQ